MNAFEWQRIENRLAKCPFYRTSLRIARTGAKIDIWYHKLHVILGAAQLKQEIADRHSAQNARFPQTRCQCHETQELFVELLLGNFQINFISCLIAVKGR